MGEPSITYHTMNSSTFLLLSLAVVIAIASCAPKDSVDPFDVVPESDTLLQLKQQMQPANDAVVPEPGSKHTNIDMTQEGWAKPKIGGKKITKERMKKALAKFGHGGGGARGARRGMVRQTCDNTCSKCNAKHKCKNSKNKKCKWIGSAGPCQDKPGSKHTNIDMTQEGWAKPKIGGKKITKERMKKALAKFG